MTEIIPKRALLCGIGYRITVADNCVIFSEEPGIAGCYIRLVFERVCGCWYVEVVSSRGSAMVAHIVAAQKLLNVWFGPDHDCTRGENVP